MKIGLNLHQITHLVSPTVGNHKLNMDQKSTSIFSFKVTEMLISVSVVYFQNIQEYAMEHSSRPVQVEPLKNLRLHLY